MRRINIREGADGIQEDSGAFLRYSAVYALMEKAYVVIFAIYFTVCV